MIFMINQKLYRPTMRPKKVTPITLLFTQEIKLLYDLVTKSTKKKKKSRAEFQIKELQDCMFYWNVSY